jgi:hypothetical protein
LKNAFSRIREYKASQDASSHEASGKGKTDSEF